MRTRYFILFILYLLFTGNAHAQFKTEQQLVNEIIVNLQKGDDSLYAAHFPNMQMMMMAIEAYSPKDSIESRRISTLMSNQWHLQQFDPATNGDITEIFQFVRKKGADSGVHWGDILIAKHELDKQLLPRELIGFELIAPLRMNGYIFIQDMLTRKRYCMPVKDIFLINNKWYGGMVMNILEATNAAEYEEKLKIEERELKKLMAAKANGTLDSMLKIKDSINKVKMAALKGDDDEERKSEFREVVDRKLYTGFFDKEIEVELYVRSLKGPCPETVCAWEAMYKFGDLDEYIILEVERKSDGSFVMTEDEVGIMELKLLGDTFTGTWTSNSDKTEYEAYLKEKDEVKSRKLFNLDKIFEEREIDR